MRATVERSHLLKSLGHVHRVVERRNTIPILSNVLLRADGGKLTCKHCHGGAPTQPSFQPKVILSDGLVTLPLRRDVPAPRAPSVPTLAPDAAAPAGSSAPSAAPSAAPAAPSPPK